MRRSYKLRLGDGTILVVDHAGLSIWLGDRKALVQPAGSDLWKPLKEFVAQERSAARRAARHQPKPPSTPRDALPLVYPKPREKLASGPPKKPIPVRADGLPLIPPPPPKPRDDPDRARRPPAPPATVVRPSLPKTPPAPVLARQPAEPRGGETKPTADSGLPRISSTPLIPPPALISPPPTISPPPPAVLPAPRDNGDKEPTLSVPSAPVEPPAEPTVVQPLAEEPASFSAESVPRLLPSDEDVGWMTLPDPLDGEPPTLPAVSWRDPLETSSASARPSLLQEALLTAPSRAASAFETHISHWIDSLARRDWQATRLWLMSQAASAHVALLALWKSLARGDRPAPSASPSEPAPRRAVDSERSAPLEPRPPVGVSPGVRVRAEKGKDSLGVYSPRRSTDDGLPILQLEPLDDEEALEIILEPVDDEVPKSVPSKLSKLDDRASAPLPIRQLPVLRPVALPRPKQVRDAHAGERLHLSGSPWTKRLVVLSCLAAGGLFAALTSETWVPKAVPGRLVVSKIDRPKQSRDEAERRRQAQQEARQRLPHLAPETIRLVLAKNATGVLDPPAVFQVTCDAVDRGSWALTPDEAQELRALRRELLDALLPSEAERVLEYDGARARRATLPFENRAALDLFARGARALPSRSRARLQVLFGKAVAAHLRAEGAPRL